MHGDEVHADIDSPASEVSDHFLAPVVQDPKAVDERRNVRKVGVRHPNTRQLPERLAISPADLLPARDEFVRTLQLRQANARHDVGEVIAIALVHNVVVPRPAVLVSERGVLVDAQKPQVVESLELFRCVHDDASTIDRSDHLDWVEAEARDIAETADLASPELRSERMARVLDHT